MTIKPGGWALGAGLVAALGTLVVPSPSQAAPVVNGAAPVAIANGASGDWNGDGKADPAVFRPSLGRWFIHGVNITNWGRDGDVPVPGDYDGNGVLEQAVWRPSDGTWYIIGGRTVQWGTAGDIPVS